MNLQDAEYRYLHDPVFAALVHNIEAMIETLKTTPSEIREVCMFATMRVEMRHPRRWLQHPDGTVEPISWRDG